jgi:hypothetical protein
VRVWAEISLSGTDFKPAVIPTQSPSQGGICPEVKGSERGTDQ